MKYLRLTIVFLFVVGAAVSTGCWHQDLTQPEEIVPRRIVSMSPGLSETLFALGVGDRVVGVSRFCTYPGEVESKQKVGGFFDPNWEAIVALQPDLVVVMESQAEVEDRLARLLIPSLRVDQHDVDSVLRSFEVLGEACGVPERGMELRRSVAQRLQAVADAVSGREKPKVLIVIGREVGGGRIDSVWAAAPGTFFDDVVSLAGGENVLTNGKMGAHPEISREGMLSLDPDVVLDIIPDLDARGLSIETALADWRGSTGLRASKNQRVVVLDKPFMSTPGPRMALVAEAVARSLHQGVPL